MEKHILGAMLRSEVYHCLNVTTNYDGRLLVNGLLQNSQECYHIPLMKPIYLVKEKDMVDEILLFMDGTIEFHEKRSKEALCWCEYDEYIIKQVINQIKCLIFIRANEKAILDIKTTIESTKDVRARVSTLREKYAVRRRFMPRYIGLGNMCYMPKLKEYRMLIGSPLNHGPKEGYVIVFKVK
jgi:hypothetical protein